MTNYEVKVISGPSAKRYEGLLKVLRPVRYFKLDESSGTVAVDATGNDNGTYSGTVGYAQPPLIASGNSIYFNGTDTLITDITAPSFFTEFSCCFWINFENNPTGSFIFALTQGINTVGVFLSNRVIVFRTSDATNFHDLIGPELVEGRSYFVCVSRDPGGRKIWINGELVAEDSNIGWVTPDLSITIGDWAVGGGLLYKGFLDEIAFFNKPMNNLEALEIFEEGPLTPLQHVADLPNARVTSIEYEPFSQGVARITLPTTDLGPIKTKGRRELQIWRNNSKIFEGPVWTIWGDSKNTFTLVEPLPSYLAKRHIEATKTYTATDILNIMWDLIDDTQTEKGTLGITAAAFTPIGVVRDAYYPADENANIGDLLLDFPEAEWAIELYDDGRREWTPYYPSRGTERLSDRLEWGGLVVDYRYSYHSINSATKVIWNGKGSGPDKPQGSYHDQNLSDLNVYMTKIRTDQNVIDIDTLNTMSKDLVEKLGFDEVIPDLKVANNPLEPDYDFVGSIKVGDIFPCYVKHDERIIIDGKFRVEKFVLDVETDTAWLTFERLVPEEGE